VFFPHVPTAPHLFTAFPLRPPWRAWATALAAAFFRLRYVEFALAASSSSWACALVVSVTRWPPIISASSPSRSFSLHQAHFGFGNAAGDFLADGQVAVGIAGDLRQVGDAQDLVVRCQSAELVADDRTKPAADVGVDLVEHQHADAVAGSQDALEGQHDARQLAAAGDLSERLGELAGVVWATNSTTSKPLGSH